MKHIFLSIMMLMAALSLSAKDEDKKYLEGAVPQDENGLVVFKKTIEVKDKSKAALYDSLYNWAKTVEAVAIHDLRTRLIEANPDSGLIIFRIEEWMVFRRLPLLLDRTRFRYALTIQCRDGKADITIGTISYYYGEDENGEKGTLYKAEEWITDEEAMNKKKTKLYRYSAKFRRKTVDRVEELFTEARKSVKAKRKKVVTVEEEEDED